ncbi:MAG: hypothetical protein QNK04_27800 [Myxococcota bacterium]|nr:hypothetical protein [Myxococcota bacterium]
MMWLLLALGMSYPGSVLGAPTIVATAPSEGEAVIDDGVLAVRKLGDEVADGRYVVKKILADRVVLELRGADGAPTSELWVYVADDTGTSRIERVETTPAPPERPDVTVPLVEGGRGSIVIGGEEQ